MEGCFGSHLWWRFFAKIVNVYWLLTIFTKELYHRGLPRSQIRRCLQMLFVIFNSWKVPWNWIAFYWNFFVMSSGLMRGDNEVLANEAYFSFLLFLWNSNAAVWKLQAGSYFLIFTYDIRNICSITWKRTII